LDFRVPKDRNLFIRQGAFGAIFVVSQIILLCIFWVFFFDRPKESLREVVHGARRKVRCVEGREIFL
jgi:hypothetical protein